MLLGGALATLATSPIASAASLCEGFATDREPRVVPPMARPAHLVPYRDPAFGSEVTRISATPPGEVVRTLYGTVQPWNADESRLVLYHSGGPAAGHHLYDGRTYERLGQLPFVPADIEELFWDPKRPPFLYYVQKKPADDDLHGQLVRYDVRSGRRKAIADVAAACGNEGGRVVPTAGGDVQGMQGDHIGLRCDDVAARGATDDVTFHVNVRTGEIGPALEIGPTIGIGGGTSGSLAGVSLAPTPSNERFLLQGSVYDRDMNFVRRVDMPLSRNALGRDIPKTEHETIGRLANGHDALFTPQFDPGPGGCDGDSGGGVGTLVAHDLQNGRCRVLIGPSTGWPYPLSGTHHSAVSAKRGWVATSSVGYGQLDYLTNGRPAPPLFSEIVLTRAHAGEPETCRLAHARTHGKSARRTARASYFGEPHPVISPSATRILFNSDWHDSGTVDTFVIDLEAGAGPASPPPAECRVRPSAAGGIDGFVLAPERRRHSDGDD